MKFFLVKFCTIIVFSIGIIGCGGSHQVNSTLVDTNENYNDEIGFLRNMVANVHGMINYGVGDSDAIFSDEIIQIGEGHCGHYSILLFLELVKEDYNPKIIGISTTNNRNHSMIFVKLKSTSEYITLDATNNIIYLSDPYYLMDNAVELNDLIIGTPIYVKYADFDFWNNVDTYDIYPYLGGYVIYDIEYEQSLVNIFDFNNDTVQFLDYVDIDLNGLHRLKSIVFYPANQEYIGNLKVICSQNNNNAIIYNDKVNFLENLISINFQDENYCQELKIEFGHSIELKDIYIYGK